MTEFTFTLLDPIKVGEKNLNTLRLCAPKACHKAFTAKLQQGVVTSLKEAADNEINSKQEKVSSDVVAAPAQGLGDTYVMTLLAVKNAGDNFFSDFCKNFISLLLQPDICFLGDHKLGSGWLDRMSNDDFDKVMGEYIAHFLLPRVMSAKT